MDTFGLLSSSIEGYREFVSLGKSTDEIADAALKMKNEAKALENAADATASVKQATKNLPNTPKLDARAAKTAATAEAKAAKTVETKAAKMSKAELETSLKDPKIGGADQIAQIKAYEKIPGLKDADIVKNLNLDPKKFKTAKGSIGKAWDTIKANSKFAALGVGITGLAIYMLATGETDPLKAAGKLAGTVIADVGVGLGTGVKSLLDGLGLTPYLLYIEVGCGVCSCLMCILFLVYIYRTFVK